MSVPLESNATPAPSYDNFYSPENVSFYESKPYVPLNRHRQEVRQIRLLPGKRDDPVVCELLPPEPLETARYLAISYCAGDPNVTKRVTVNGLDFNAFANLEAALRKCRQDIDDYDEKRPPAPLWADQICIDQSNPLERAHQVAFMRNIYERAGRVKVWLGDEGRGGAGLGWLHGQYGNILDFLEPLNLDPKNQDDEETLGAIDYTCEVIGKALAEDYIHDPDLVEAWMGLRDLMYSPWWGRCWVTQELIVSRTAVIMCGDEIMLWDQFRIAYGVVRAFVRAAWIHALARSRNDPNVERETKHLKSLIYNWQTHIDFMIDQHTEWRKESEIPMKELLQHARRAHSSDPRDRIYAFAGLAASDYGIIPNYEASNSVIDAHCHVMKQIVLRDGELEMLSLAQNHIELPPDLPSWTPFWGLEADRLSFATELAPYHNASGGLRAPILSTIHLGRQESPVPTESVDDVETERRKARAELADRHRQEVSTSEDRCFFLSPREFIGVANGMPLHTDLLVVLLGGKVPFILRNVGEQYTLVGEAYVHGFMDERAIDMWHQGELEIQSFDII
ncbi:hypothetical protein N0V91_006502 [Didymella pomorum]|uniref:Heterokaryon incompatibility domain-containing protein n=1 Tax=Didymella pomorum TaxID=749634 RepID=A0A9W8ZCR2_9PLEO|nr:hypothetical protein N0V91_006502 [Didymella pomorum]